jgi:hypothetical protein
VGDYTLKLNEWNQDVVLDRLVYGFKKTLRDSFAGETDPKKCRAKCDAVMANWEAGLTGRVHDPVLRIAAKLAVERAGKEKKVASTLRSVPTFERFCKQNKLDPKPIMAHAEKVAAIERQAAEARAKALEALGELDV